MKTAEALSDKFQVKMLSTFSNITNAADFYGVTPLEHIRVGYGIEDNFFLEIIDRMVFSVLAYIITVLKNPEVIYTRDIAFLAFMSLLPGRENALVFECHKLLDRNSKFPTVLQDFALRRTDLIFCVSNGVKSDVEKKVSEQQDVYLQRNCVDLERFEDLETSLENEKTTLAYIGSFKEHKDVKTLIQAFKQLDKKIYRLKLIGVKEKEDFDRFGGLEGVETHGFLSEDDLIDQIASSDILIFTSDKSLHQKRYTSPMKIFEYMASKRPVLAADLSTVREIAGDSIYYYKPGEVDNLTNQIKKINEEDWTEKVSEAYNIIESDYTWEAKANFIKQKIEEFQN